jgi:CheY-like chemotaxis protein
MPLTAYAHSEDARRALKAGFQTRVVKPVEPIELATAPPSLWPDGAEAKKATKKAPKR